MLRALPLWLAVLATLPGAAGAATLSFQDGVAGYAGTEDAFLVQDGLRDHVNWGGRHDLYVGPFSGGATPDEVNRTLIRFDVSALAGQYAQITSITLRLTIEAAHSVGNTVELYQPVAANGDWVEGGSDGAVQNGASSWANKQEPGTAWTGGPGLGSTGFGALLASTSFLPLATGLLELAILDAGVATALIDDFLNGANEGFFLKAQDESHPGMRSDILLFSSERGTIAERPMLIVEYTPVPEPGAAFALLAAAAALAASRRRQSRARWGSTSRCRRRRAAPSVRGSRGRRWRGRPPLSTRGRRWVPPGAAAAKRPVGGRRRIRCPVSTS